MQMLKQIDLTREVIKLQPDKTLYDARNALLFSIIKWNSYKERYNQSNIRC